MRENKRFFWIFLIIIIFFGMAFFQVFEYSRQSKNLIQKQTYFALSEQAQAVRNNLQLRIEEQFLQLEALAEYISRNEEFSLEDEFIFGQYISSFSNFNQVGIASGGTGNVEFADGVGMNVANEEYFKNSMQGNRSIEYFQEEGGESGQLVLSTPIFRGDEIISVLFATVNNDLVEDCMDSTFFEGNSFLCITDSQGNFLDFGKQYDCVGGQDNLLSFLNSNNVDTYEISFNLDNDLASSFSYSKDGETRFNTYIPLNIGDFYLLCSIPDNAVTQSIEEFETLGINVIMKIMLISCAVCILIYVLLRRVEATIKGEHERFRLAEEVAGMVSFEGDYKKDTVVINENYYKQYGRETFLQKISDFVKPQPFIIEEDQEVFLKMGENLVAGKETGNVEYRFICKDGTLRWQQIVYRVFHDKSGAPIKCYGMIVPIDQQMKEISKLQMQVEKDPMTGVLNRMAFELNVNLCFKGGLGEESHALLLLDLDDFKQINDGYGHALGDKALIITAEILKSCVPNNDYVGRLGGDEFAVFLKNVNEEQAAKKAAEICEALEKAEMKSDEAVITCSIGIACFPKDGCGFNELYELADQGLYKVKGTGKNSYALA